MDLNPLCGTCIRLFLLEPRDIEQLIDEPIETVNVFHHGAIKLLPLLAVNRSAVEGLEIELQRGYWSLKFVCYGIDEIALPPIEIDVLDNPNQIEDYTGEHKSEHDRANTEEYPIDIEATLIGGLQCPENVDQYPAYRQPNEDDDHEYC
jgi:hypothetical protein